MIRRRISEENKRSPYSDQKTERTARRGRHLPVKKGLLPNTENLWGLKVVLTEKES